jgi:hypothetical protein
VYGTQIINSRRCFIGCLASLEKSGLPYHVYAKEKKEKGKKERIQNFLDVGLSFTLLSTSLSMRPGIATDTFLWLVLGNVVHPPGSNRKDSAPNGLNRKDSAPNG